MTYGKYVIKPMLIAFILMVYAGCMGDEFVPWTDSEDAIVDSEFLSDTLWDDGRAEVSFYQVERERDQYGDPADQVFIVGTYLVKHDFDPWSGSKAVGGRAVGVEAFKYALFYQIESGGYEYKRSYIVNSARETLQPLKQSFASFDWCSNLYREFLFTPEGNVSYLMRSDDYGNEDHGFPYRSNSYPVALLPVLARSISFADADTVAFNVVLADGRYVGAKAVYLGEDNVTVSDGDERAAEVLAFHYDETVPSVVGEETDSSETYWRATDPERILLRIESETGRYVMSLLENIRSAYWEEDFFTRLSRVTERP